MYHKQKHNATCRKHKRAKRVMTPRNRLRKRKCKRALSFSVKPSNNRLSYSRKKHRKLRTKTIKRRSFKDVSSKVIGGFSGFSEEDLVKGIIVFANNTPDVKDVFKDNPNAFMPTQYDNNSNDDFKDIKSLPLLMTIYSVITQPTFISGTTTVNSVTDPDPVKTRTQLQTDQEVSSLKDKAIPNDAGQGNVSISGNASTQQSKIEPTKKSVKDALTQKPKIVGELRRGEGRRFSGDDLSFNENEPTKKRVDLKNTPTKNSFSLNNLLYRRSTSTDKNTEFTDIYTNQPMSVEPPKGKSNNVTSIAERITGIFKNQNKNNYNPKGGKKSGNPQPEKDIPNKILLKFVISKIREIERKHPHPDLLNTFLYFFDILDFPSALAMVNLYLTKLYELTKGKDMSYDKITTYLEKNLAHHASFDDWKGALETAKDDPEKMRKMYLKYTSVVNSIDPYERAQSELNSLFSSAWKPFDPLVSQLDINTNADKTGNKIDITGVGRATTDKSGVIASSKVTVDSHGVWWTNDTDKSNYEVIPNEGNGDCYFLSIAEALDEYNKQNTNYFTYINTKTTNLITYYNNSLNQNTGRENIDTHIHNMVKKLNTGEPKRKLSFDPLIQNNKITVTNMRSLLALLYFSEDWKKQESYRTRIHNGVKLYKSLEKTTRTDDTYSFHYFSDTDDEKNIAHILSNNYFADEMVIDILQKHYEYKTIALANHLLTSQNTFVARTPVIDNPLFYVMVNYTNGNHYELIKYSADGKPANKMSALKSADIPKRIQDQYNLTEKIR
jgi:hypothetical protein